MGKCFKNDVIIPIGFTVLNMSLLIDIFWYGQTKYNHHYSGYTNVCDKRNSRSNHIDIYS